MKIAINALSVQGGGGATFLKNLLKHLLTIDRLNEYVVFATERQKTVLGLSNGNHSNLRTIDCPARGWVVRSWWEQVVLPVVLRREKVDVLYAPGNQGPVLCPCPLVVLIQNVDPLVNGIGETPLHLQVKRKALRIMTHASIHQSQKVIAISEYTRHLLAQEFGCDPQSIAVIPHGSPDDACLPPSLEALERSKKYMIESPYFLAVSNIKYNKNYGKLVEAFAIATGITSRQINLVIAGEIEDRERFLRLKDLIQQSGISSQVYFLGGVDQETLRVLYGGAQALVFPSCVESFGLPPLEAMAYGVPVAASRIDSVLEVCGDAVLYFDPSNPQEMARTMIQILEDDGLKKALVQRGRARSKQFSWKETASRTLELLEEAVSSN